MPLFAATLILLAFSTGGCDSKTPATPTAAAPRPGGAASAAASDPNSPQVQVGTDPAASVDSQDDAEAPRALPRTGTVPKWSKSRPVRVLSGDAAVESIKDETLKAAMRQITTQRIATCAYSIGSMTGEVVYIEAPAFDALSLFTTMDADPKPLLKTDGSMRGCRAGAANIAIAWQGRVYVQVSVSSENGLPTPEPVAQLLDRIVFSLPSTDPPVLMRIIPKEKRDQCRVYFARTADMLKLANLESLQKLPAEEVNRQLALGKTTMISVAAVEVIPTEPHLIWLAEYPTVDAAKAAYADCTAAITAAASPLAKTTEIKAAGGPYLVGTWTKRQEAIQPLLPLLLSALPEPQTSTTRPASAPAP